MIKVTELNEFLKKKGNVCDRHTTCDGCPLWSGRGDGYCAAKYGEVTQGQIDAVMEWEPPVDWSKVAPDTKIIVWENPERKYKRYFAKYQDGKIYAFDNGSTSWSHVPNCLIEWPHGELAKEDE